MITCRPGSASAQVAPSSSEARAPVGTQNATSARSRCDPSPANSSLNCPSGMLRGARCGSRGRNSPDRPWGNGSIGLWCAARRLRPSGNGFTIGPVPASRWKSQKCRRTVSQRAAVAGAYPPAVPGFPAISSHRQKSPASVLVTWSQPGPAAQQNRNHRGKSIPYDRSVDSGRPHACTSFR